MKRGLGVILLAIYLLLEGLAGLLGLTFPYRETLMALLALLAGVLLLLGR